MLSLVRMPIGVGHGVDLGNLADDHLQRLAGLRHQPNAGQQHGRARPLTVPHTNV